MGVSFRTSLHPISDWGRGAATVHVSRRREAGYRNVACFEAAFVGKARSPLGKLGGRFQQRLEPMSVGQIALYRKEGRRRPLDLGDA